MNGYEAQTSRASPAAKARPSRFRGISTPAALVIIAQVLQLGTVPVWAFVMYFGAAFAGGLPPTSGFAEALTLMLFITYPLWLLYGGVSSWLLFYLRMRKASVAVAAVLTAPTLLLLGWLVWMQIALGVQLSRLGY